MKLLPGWATALRHNYQSNIFTRTWWNIVIFHTFFVAVMVLVFAFILHNTKTSLFLTLSEMIQTIAAGEVVNSTVISQTSQEIDRINLVILVFMVIFAAVTGILAAHITLIPTRDEFAQRKRFITAVAHELRTPLAVLRTSNEVALYDLDNKNELQTVLKSNIEETKHIANMLNNLLVFSRVGATESLPFESTGVSTSLRSVIKKLELFAQKQNVTINYQETELPSIAANATSLEQVFYNIIKNAIIYSKNVGGEVNISSSADSSYVTVVIADNGIGMSEKNLTHIFEPFFRVNPDASQFAGGTGLGLSLVYEIMKIHQGILTVHSKENEGTKFTLQFPLSPFSLLRESKPHSSNTVSFSFEK